MAYNEVDVVVRNCGTIIQFFTMTEAAKEWVRDNVDIPNFLSMGKSGFNCDHRCATDLVYGMELAGLVVQDAG